MPKKTATVFKNRSEKVYSLTYTPDKILASSTAIPRNFSVTYDDEAVDISELFYYPAKNLMIMNVGVIDSTDSEYAEISANGIKDTDGNAYALSGKAALTRVADPQDNAVSVTAVYCKSGVEPIFNLIGKSNVTIVVRITNTSSSQAEKTIAVYDGEECIGQQNVSIAADDFTEIAIPISGHIFIQNKADIKIQ